jgi:hypothetical protein
MEKAISHAERSSMLPFTVIAMYLVAPSPSDHLVTKIEAEWAES